MATRTPDPLGLSLALRDGDLAFTAVSDPAGNVRRDLALVTGRDNLHQGLKAILETPFGTDIFNANYGFDLAASLGLDVESVLTAGLGTNRSAPQGTARVKELLRLNLVRSLAADDRIAEVREVVFDDDPRFFELVADADPAASRAAHQDRRWRVVALLALRDGGEDLLQLSGTRI